MLINRLIGILITSLNNRKQINRSIKIFLKLTGREGVVVKSITLHIVPHNKPHCIIKYVSYLYE